jgi:hypothetical protein
VATCIGSAEQPETRGQTPRAAVHTTFTLCLLTFISSLAQGLTAITDCGAHTGMVDSHINSKWEITTMIMELGKVTSETKDGQSNVHFDNITLLNDKE